MVGDDVRCLVAHTCLLDLLLVLEDNGIKTQMDPRSAEKELSLLIQALENGPFLLNGPTLLDRHWST